MSTFIRLTSVVLNSLKINKIEINNNMYVLHLINNKIDGFFLFSSGFIDACNDKIVICKNKDPMDYKMN